MKFRGLCIIIICTALFAGIGGFVYSKAGDDNTVIVNGYPMYEGDMVMATMSLNTKDKLLTKYYGVVKYDSNIFEVDHVDVLQNGVSYSTETAHEFRFIQADTSSGIQYSEGTDLLNVYFKVKDTDGERHNISYKYRDVYELNRASMTESRIDDYKDMTGMVLAIFVDQNNIPTMVPSETAAPEKTAAPAVKPTMKPEAKQTYKPKENNTNNTNNSNSNNNYNTDTEKKTDNDNKDTAVGDDTKKTETADSSEKKSSRNSDDSTKSVNSNNDIDNSNDTYYDNEDGYDVAYNDEFTEEENVYYDEFYDKLYDSYSDDVNTQDNGAVTNDDTTTMANTVTSIGEDPIKLSKLIMYLSLVLGVAGIFGLASSIKKGY